MDLSQLITAVRSAVHDSDYTESIITEHLNEAVLAVATGVLIPGRRQLSPPLPDLYTTDDVVTVLNTGYLTLPADYNRNVIMVVDSDGNTLTRAPSWLKFMKDNADKAAGGANKYVVSGNRLYYRDIPTAPKTLTVHYYKNPTPMVADTDIPTDVPITLHRDLLVGYAAREIFNVLELGMAGQKIDTTSYGNIFISGILKLVDILPEDGEPDYYDDTTDYIDG